MAKPRTDLTGKVFARWNVVAFAGGKGATVAYRCRCSCGTERNVLARSLNSGASRSCGCLHDEYVATHWRTHGATKTREFGIWQMMNQRCYNKRHPHYSRYGGRGITVCKRWRHSFKNFIADVGPAPSKEHSIDRKNNDGHYIPGNVRWATREEQGRNRRTNRMLTCNGLTLPAAEWAERIGVNRSTLYGRLRKGWPIHRVLSPHVSESHSTASRSRR